MFISASSSKTTKGSTIPTAAGYATCADFCKVFNDGLERLYILDRSVRDIMEAKSRALKTTCDVSGTLQIRLPPDHDRDIQTSNCERAHGARWAG